MRILTRCLSCRACKGQKCPVFEGAIFGLLPKVMADRFRLHPGHNR